MNFADISHHNGSVDLAAYKAAGHDRISMKATEGIGFTDPTFAARWRQAERLGLARVAYHYDRAKFSGADQFDFCLSVVRAAGGLGERDRIMLDTEDTETPSRARASSQAFAARAVARGHLEGLVYTGRWFADPNGITAGIFPPGWRRLILSHYDTAVPDSKIPLPDGWTRDQCVARQFTDRATVAGVAGGCDYNRILIDWLQEGILTTVDLSPAALAAVRQQVIVALADPTHAYLQDELAPLKESNVRELISLGALAATLDALTVKLDTLTVKVDALTGVPLSEQDKATLAAAAGVLNRLAGVA